MTGADLIDVAARLTANAAAGESEARYRSAASRAYYGAFHLVCGFLKQKSGLAVLKNHHGHRQAYLNLLTTARPEAIEAARLLDDLRSDRNRADYDLQSAKFRTLNNAKQCVEMAYAIKASLGACDA